MVEFNGNEARSRNRITVHITPALVGALVASFGIGGGWVYDRSTETYPGGKTPDDVYALIQRTNAEDQRRIYALERDLAILETRFNSLKGRVDLIVRNLSADRVDFQDGPLPQARTSP